jgi:tetratricopeptide (TPR) repeat protein
MSIRTPFVAFCLLLILSSSAPVDAAPALAVPPETSAVLEKIYSLHTDEAVQAAWLMEQQRPEHPLGYLLEAEALWWRIWCAAMDYKYGLSDARRRAKSEADKHYLELAAKVSSLAEAQLKQQESAEMHFYAGMGDALASRLHGLRGENRPAARQGVRGREHFLRTKALDPDLVDADLGLGLYNYYVDTLSGLARVMRFFMGIPGGSKQDGIRQLEHVIAHGVISSDVARFYLAMNLHRYDQHYEKALSVITPLADKYPSNPIFQLARGDLLGKLGRKEQAIAAYRSAAAVAPQDPDCRARIQELVRLSIAAQGAPSSSNQ